MPNADALSALYDHVPPMLREMPDRFTTHEFILRLARRHQPEYVAALSAYAVGGEPFRAVHQQISAHLHKYPDLRDDGVAQSVDIFGNPNTCKKWQRV